MRFVSCILTIFPECISISIDDGSPEYLQWVGDSVRSSRQHACQEHFPRSIKFGSDRGECLIQIVKDIVHVLNADRDPN